MDAAAELRVMRNLRSHLEGVGLVWILNRVEEAEMFDVVLVMEDGKVVEQGTWAELHERADSVLKRLLEH
jgi:ABC-type transport system involved in cytochrome bd biosynthesis fused ATPase/permease subunit